MEPKDIDVFSDMHNYVGYSSAVAKAHAYYYPAQPPKDMGGLPPLNTWDIQYQWTGEKIDSLNVLINWSYNLPPNHLFQMSGMGSPVPVTNITRWLRAQIGAGGYTDQTREILNELIQIRKEWIHGN